MERRHQPRPGLREFRPGQPTAGQTCSRKVPEATTSAFPHNATEVQGSCPQRSGEALELSQGWLEALLPSHRWVHWEDTSNMRGHTRIFARAYYLRPNNASHVVVGRTMCHAGTKGTKPSIAPSPEPWWGLTLIEQLLTYCLVSGRSRSDGRKLSIPLTSSTLAARRGEPSTNLLAGLDAPSPQTPSPRDSWRTGYTGQGIANPPGR